MPMKFEQNRMVQTTRNFELLDQKTNKQKRVFFITISDKELTPFLEDVSAAEIIFWC